MSYESKIIDGRYIANQFSEEIKEQVEIVEHEHNLTPGLVIIRVGEHPSSVIYVQNKLKKAHELGIRANEVVLPADISEKNLLVKVSHYNNDAKTHGIIVQLPLPSHIDSFSIINAINPSKDVDGFHPQNLGKLIAGRPHLVPCTALGIIRLLKSYVADLAGKHAVVVGRSNIVGKPVAFLLLKENCTVTIAHSKTQDLERLIGEADILVAAVGVPEMIKGSWIKKGAIVIDVGINKQSLPDDGDEIVGDIEFKGAIEKASLITPVPGGVGPMTVVSLMANTLKAACQQRNIEFINESIAGL